MKAKKEEPKKDDLFLRKKIEELFKQREVLDNRIEYTKTLYEESTGHVYDGDSNSNSGNNSSSKKTSGVDLSKLKVVEQIEYALKEMGAASVTDVVKFLSPRIKDLNVGSVRTCMYKLKRLELCNVDENELYSIKKTNK